MIYCYDRSTARHGIHPQVCNNIGCDRIRLFRRSFALEFTCENDDECARREGGESLPRNVIFSSNSTRRRCSEKKSKKLLRGFYVRKSKSVVKFKKIYPLRPGSVEKSCFYLNTIFSIRISINSLLRFRTRVWCTHFSPIIIEMVFWAMRVFLFLYVFRVKCLCTLY